MTRDPVVFTPLGIAIINAITSINNLKRMSQMNHFRPLNENEIRCLHKHSTYKSPIDPEIVMQIEVAFSRSQGGFTVCNVKCILTGGYVVLLSGASRRSYKDKPNTIRGEILAFRRAIQTKPILLSSQPNNEDVPF